MPAPLVKPVQEIIDHFLATMEALYGSLSTRESFHDFKHRHKLKAMLQGCSCEGFRWANLGKPMLQTCTSIQQFPKLLFLYSSGHAALYCALRQTTVAYFGYAADPAQFWLTRREGCYPCLQNRAVCAPPTEEKAPE